MGEERLRKVASRISILMYLLFLIVAASALFHISKSFTPPATIDMPEPYVIFAFDDGHNIKYVVQNVLPIFEQYGWKGIVFPDTEYFEYYKDYLSTLHQKGWEVGAHTHTHPHLNQTSAQQLKDEMEIPQTLIEPFIGEEIITFAYPYGEGWNNDTVYTVVRSNYKYERPTKFVMQAKYGYIDSLGVPFDGNSTEVQKAIDFANSTGRSIWLVFHGVRDDPSNPQDITIADFQECVDLVATSGMKVATMKQILTNIQMTTEDEAYKSVQQDEEAVSSAFQTVLETEKAGANVSDLVMRLNESGDLLVEAKILLENEEFNEAIKIADHSAAMADEVKDDASSVLASALIHRDFVSKISVIGAMGGIATFLFFMFLLWHWFKGYYVRRILRTRPEVVKDFEA